MFLCFGMFMYWGGMLVQKYVFRKKTVTEITTTGRWFLISMMATHNGTTLWLTTRYYAEDGAIRHDKLRQFVIDSGAADGKYIITNIFEMTRIQFERYS